MGKCIRNLSTVTRSLGLDLAKRVFQVHASPGGARSLWRANSRVAS